MNEYEIYSLGLGAVTLIFTIIFACFQIRINYRLKKLEDFVAVSIIPNSARNIIIMNTGKINLYLHKYKIHNSSKTFDQGRLVTSGTLNSSYYLLPLENLPKIGEFDITLWLTDEFGKKYKTLGGGEVISDEKGGGISVWTFKTKKIKQISILQIRRFILHHFRAH